MTEEKQVYRCNICGNIAEILHIGVGKLACCEQQMELLKERIGDLGPEKHIPVIKKTDKGVKVKVGEIPHPMEENHFIEWIELIADNHIYRKDLKPKDNPEAEFELDLDEISEIRVREYCNIHGLWKSV